MKLVLTGAGGFLGTELLNQLASEDDVQVLAVSSRVGFPGACGFPEQRITVVSPNDLLANPDLMAGFDVLLNCAFPRNVDGEALARGLDFISSLFRAAATRVKAVVNVSSQSVYSQHRTMPATEDTPVCLESAYAVAKYATELMLEEACGNIPHTNIRLASLIGPGFDQRVVNKMVAKVLAGERITVLESGSRYGYLDARDASAGLIKLIRSNPVHWESLYNLGSDMGATLSEIAICVVDVTSAFGIESQLPDIVMSECTAINTTLNAGCFVSAFNWHPEFDMIASTKSITEFLVYRARSEDIG